MSVFRRYSQAGGAIHDLEYIAGLSSERTIPLLLSPRVSYVLTNLVNQDLGFECRWAVERQEGGYLRLTTDDTEYSLFVDVLSAAGYEIRERQAGMGTLMNFKETIVGATLNLNASAGANVLTLSPPTGEAWVVEAFAAVNVNTVCTRLTFTAGIIGGNDAWLDSVASPVAGIYTTRQGPVTLDENSEIKAVFEGCSAGDDLYFRVFGYSMDLVA